MCVSPRPARMLAQPPGVAVHHPDLIGTAECDQPEGTQNCLGHIAFDFSAGRQCGHVPAGVGDQKDLVVFLGHEALDQHRARPRGGLPVDIPNVVARHVRPQVVEFHTAGVQQGVAATFEEPAGVSAEEPFGPAEMGSHASRALEPRAGWRRSPCRR